MLLLVVRVDVAAVASFARDDHRVLAAGAVGLAEALLSVVVLV